MSAWQTRLRVVALSTLVGGAVVLAWRAWIPSANEHVTEVSLGQVTRSGQPLDISVEVQNPYDAELKGVRSAVSCKCLQVQDLGSTIPARAKRQVKIQFAVPAGGGSFAYYAELKAESHPEWSRRVLVTGEVPQRPGTLPSAVWLPKSVLTGPEPEIVELLVWEAGRESTKATSDWEARVSAVSDKAAVPGHVVGVESSVQQDVAGHPRRLRIALEPDVLRNLASEGGRILRLLITSSMGDRHEVPLCIEDVPPDGWDPAARPATQRLLRLVAED